MSEICHYILHIYIHFTPHSKAPREISKKNYTSCWSRQDLPRYLRLWCQLMCIYERARNIENIKKKMYITTTLNIMSLNAMCMFKMNVRKSNWTSWEIGWIDVLIEKERQLFNEIDLRQALRASSKIEFYFYDKSIKLPCFPPCEFHNESICGRTCFLNMKLKNLNESRNVFSMECVVI